MSEAASQPNRGSRAVLVGVVVGLVIAVAALVIALLALLRPWGLTVDAKGTGDTYRNSAVVIGAPTLVTEAELRQFGRAYGPLYWAGPRDDALYELTVTAEGAYFVRYLPEGVDVGDDAAQYLSVATYPVVQGYDLLEARGKEDGAQAVGSESGALVLSFDSDDSRAYFAFPERDFQVEVFAPDDGKALELVSDGTVEPAM